MSSPPREFSETLRECGKNLVLLRDRLSELKRKYLDRTKAAHRPDLERLKKATEELDKDLDSAGAMMAGLMGSSSAVGLLRRIIGGRAAVVRGGGEPSWTFRTYLLASTGRFLQERLEALEVSAKEIMAGRRKISKRHNRKDLSTCSEQSEESHQSVLIRGKRGSEDIEHRCGRPWRISETPLQQIEPTNVCFFTRIRRKSEKSAQTDSLDFVPEVSKGKLVQTEELGRSSIMGEIFEALKKISEDYLSSDRSVWNSSDFSLDELSMLSERRRKPRVVAEDGPLRVLKRVRRTSVRLRPISREHLFPEVYHLKEESGQVEWEGGVSVRISRYLDGLHIHHSHQPGTVVLSDFNRTQAEVLGSIVRYLVALPPPQDKT